jgi:hypothetical protein
VTKRRLLLASLAPFGVFPVALLAQSHVADSLLEHGALMKAESVFYADVRVHPHDPIARRQLGTYLVQRGAPRVGMTLFEEAERFGAEPRAVSRLLAPVYLSLGEYHALATLTASPLTRGELERARWLDAHPTTITAPDSVLTAAYHAATEPGYLGHVTIRVNGRPAEAVISVRSRGIALAESNAAAKSLRRFAAASPKEKVTIGAPAVADSIGLGRLSIVHYPVTVERLGDGVAAVIGLDVLGRFAPTFDARTSRITLRTSGRADPKLTDAEALPTRITDGDFLVLRGGGWMSAALPQMTRLLGDHRWTLDARRGQILVER